MNTEPLRDQFGRNIYPTTITPAQREREWAAEKKITEDAIAARQQREQQREADREKAARAQGAAELAETEERALVAWRHAGGDATGFYQAWPAMKAQILTGRALDGMNAEERAIAAAEQRLKASGRYEPL